MDSLIDLGKWVLHSYGPVVALGAVMVLGPLVRALWRRAITRDGQMLTVVERATAATAEGAAAKREVAAELRELKRGQERIERLLDILVQSRSG